MFVQFVQSQKCDRGIGAAAAQATAYWDFLFKMDLDAVLYFCALKESRRRAMDKVSGIGRQLGEITGELNAAAFAGERKFIADVNRMHDRFQFVETVRAFAENVQQQIDLAG